MPISARSRFLLAAAAGLLATACATGSDAPAEPSSAPDVDTASGADDADAPDTIVVSHAEGEVTLDAPAEAVVSLSPSSTEMLFAIGAGDQVVATDVHSDFPAEAPSTEMSGFDPNVEAIAELDPDLVVVSADRNDIVAGLDALDVPVLVHPSASTLDDVDAQLLALGEATGRADQARTLAAELTSRLEELADAAPVGTQDLSYYHELSPDHHTATSETFVGQLYDLLGLTNIADEAPDAGDAGGFPQLAPEYVVEADPDLVFVTHTDDVDELIDRPGWDELTAVQQGSVIALDADIASRWGPRIVEQVEAALAAVEAHLGTSTG